MFDLLLGMMIGIGISVAITYIILDRAARRADEELTALIESIQEQQKNSISARVEEHDGVYYVYNIRDNSFLAQGSNLNELKDRIESRVKDVRVFVTEGDADVLQRLKSTQNIFEVPNA